MFIGHFAVGFGLKRVAPRAPLTLLIVAATLLDLLWPILLWLGLERVRIAPGTTAFTPLDFESYPISHSLLTVVGWAALLGAGYAAVSRDRRGAWWVGFGVLSHWLLDWITHRPDLPLVPWGTTKVGMGLWNWPTATIVTEWAMFVAGLTLYLRATRARGLVGHLSLWSMVALLGLAYYANLQGPPPSIEALKIGATIGSVLTVWFVWIDRTREARTG
jgi:membrane-bound metal-dependent hydrolase YbcI (DUF457 family)